MALKTEFLANGTRPIADSLASALVECKEAFFVVAYGTSGGLELLNAASALTDLLKSGNRLRVLFDADRQFTDPDLINELATFPADVEVRLYAPRAGKDTAASPPPAFHPKVYLFESDDESSAIIGSANFTHGGLKHNAEAAVRISGPANSPILAEIREFMESAWDSPHQIGVLDNSAFMQAYEEAFRLAQRRQRAVAVPSEAPAYPTPDDVAALQAAAELGNEALLNSITAYILGLISAGYQEGNLSRRSVSVELRRGQLNRGNQYSGKVFFEGVSERGLLQRDCVQRDAQRIFDRLKRAFTALKTGDAVQIERRTELSYRFHLGFKAKSPVWRVVRQELKNARTSRRYLWPVQFDIESDVLRRAFVQGYMDLRTRISATDALPPPERIMRLAVSVGGKAPTDFAANLRRLMAAEFDCDPGRINLLDGSSRGRESIIRIDARLIPRNYLESHWQRIVVEDFRDYNHRIARH